MSKNSEVKYVIRVSKMNSKDEPILFDITNCIEYGNNISFEIDEEIRSLNSMLRDEQLVMYNEKDIYLNVERLIDYSFRFLVIEILMLVGKRKYLLCKTPVFPREQSKYIELKRGRISIWN